MQTTENQQYTTFVTGASGMLGTHLIKELLDAGYKIKALKRKKTSLQNFNYFVSIHSQIENELTNKIEWIEGDIFDYELLIRVLADVHICFHVAAMVSFDENQKYEMYLNNVKGTAQVVNACLHTGVRLCHVSSVAALGGRPQTPEIDENTERYPNQLISTYAQTKYLSEMEVWRGIHEGLQAVIVNPSVIVGFGNTQFGSPAMLKMGAKGMKYYTSGVTGFVDVRDVAKCMRLLAENIEFYQNRYIVSAENLDFKTFFSLISQKVGVKSPTLEATKGMLNLAIFLSKIWYFISGNKPKITKDLVRAAQQISKFSNQKIKDVLNFEFIPIAESVEYHLDCMRTNRLI